MSNFVYSCSLSNQMKLSFQEDAELRVIFNQHAHVIMACQSFVGNINVVENTFKNGTFYSIIM
jgi:hypothetical protein